MDQEIPLTPQPDTTTPHQETPVQTPVNNGGSKGGGKKVLIVLLVLVLMALSAAGAWYYQQQEIKKLKNENASLEAANAQPAQAEVTKVNIVTTPDAAFTAELPEGWTFGLCAEVDTVFLAPSAGLLGKCQTENGGTVVLSRTNASSVTPESQYKTAANTDVTYSTVDVAGVSGIKATYTTTAEGAGGYPPAGTKVTVYETVKDGKLYSFTYNQLPGEADNSATFESIVSSIVIP